MATKTKKTQTKRESLLTLYEPAEALRRWRKIKGILKGKGPKNPVAWQRKIRKDRKVI